MRKNRLLLTSGLLTALAFAEASLALTDRPITSMNQQSELIEPEAGSQQGTRRRSAEDNAIEVPKDTQQAFKEGLIKGKLATALSLNKDLRAADVVIEVEGPNVRLTGTVDSKANKELAESIAHGIDGVEQVDNRLVVVPIDEPDARSRDANTRNRDANKRESKGDLSQYVDDVTTTASIMTNASIMTELLASDEINGLRIGVDTENNKVALNGTVQTEVQKLLVKAIAEKHDSVNATDNQLKVES